MIGKIVSHYKILEKIGAGGMGVVYKAQDTKLDRLVALKFLPKQFNINEEEKSRFIHEAKAAAALDHPNICSIHEIDETEAGQMFIAMGYYEGETLKDKIASGPLPLTEAMNIAIQIAQGLEEAHEKSIIHRDVKSANIIFTEKNETKILDFGLAKLRGQTKLTKEGTTLGTVAYMSPEQAAGEEVDHRSDIWSLGVVIYEMITGQLPFKGEYEQTIMYAIMNEEPEPVTGLRTGVPLELERIVNKALSRDPEERYQHADELIVDLKKVKTESQAAVAVQKSTSQLSKQPPSKLFKYGFAVAAAAVILLAGYFVVKIIFQQEKIPVLEKPMLVILPFQNLGDPDNEYFTDGMHEEVTTRLAMVRNLGVISASSAREYVKTEKSTKEIGKELGVRYILKGTVRWARSGTDSEKIRVSTQLIRVADDIYIWADTYDRVLDDTFKVQTEIARRVVEELNVTLGENERRNVESSLTKNMEAYHAFLKAEYLIGRPHFTQNMWPEVIKNYERAVELDPEFALAWAELSRSHARLVFFSLDLTEERKEKAKAAARRAMELNPGSPRIHLSLSYYHLWISRDDNKALADLEIAQKGLPNNTRIMDARANIFELQGRFRE
ncbi:MAG: protein kinase, partial [Deltaproteobacteria bacterium]|nr:protein kinase [Deltaproteobacteria bacterium]